MTAPFRDEESSALVRAEQLEADNAELAKEIEALRAAVGENRNAYVKHLEDQVADLKRENAHLESRLRDRNPSPTVVTKPVDGKVMLIGGAIAVGFAILEKILSMLTHH